MRDGRGDVCDWNPAALRMLGLDDEQLRRPETRDRRWQLTNDGLRSVASADPLAEALAIASELGQATVTVRKADGSVARITVRGNDGIDDARLGVPNATVFTLVDVTAQRQAESENARYREIIDTLDDSHRILEESPVGICAVDVDGRVLRNNMAFLALAGCDTPTIFSLVRDDDAETLREEFSRLLDGRASSVRIETRISLPGRPAKWCEITAVAMRQGRSDAAILLLLNDVTERRRRETRLRQLAERDPLTGVHNRRSFIHVLRERLRALAHTAGGRPENDSALLLLDLDGFKSINDTWGHAVGDAVLTAVAAGIRDRTRVADTVGRLGGDEFALLLELREPASASAIAEDLIARIGDAARSVIDRPEVTASVGIVHLRAEFNADEALDLADRAMYAAKRAGKGRYREGDATSRASL